MALQENRWNRNTYDSMTTSMCMNMGRDMMCMCYCYAYCMQDELPPGNKLES